MSDPDDLPKFGFLVPLTFEAFYETFRCDPKWADLAACTPFLGWAFRPRLFRKNTEASAGLVYLQTHAGGNPIPIIRSLLYKTMSLRRRG